MKRLVTAAIVTILLVALAATGCSNKGLIGSSQETGEEAVNSCVTCHTDKDILKEVAAPEPEQAASAETSGEG